MTNQLMNCSKECQGIIFTPCPALSMEKRVDPQPYGGAFRALFLFAFVFRFFVLYTVLCYDSLLSLFFVGCFLMKTGSNMKQGTLCQQLYSVTMLLMACLRFLQQSRLEGHDERKINESSKQDKRFSFDISSESQWKSR